MLPLDHDRHLPRWANRFWSRFPEELLETRPPQVPGRRRGFLESTRPACRPTGTCHLDFKPRSQRLPIWWRLGDCGSVHPTTFARVPVRSLLSDDDPTRAGARRGAASTWVGRSGGLSRDGRQRRQPGGSIGRAFRPKICFAALRAAGLSRVGRRYAVASRKRPLRIS